MDAKDRSQEFRYVSGEQRALHTVIHILLGKEIKLRYILVANRRDSLMKEYNLQASVRTEDSFDC
jgi:hypothetical protein